MQSRRAKNSYRNYPTRIPRRPVRGQLALSLQPRERLAKRRRRARIRGAFIGIVVLSGAVWAGGLLSYSDRLTIQDISVSGTSALAPRAVQAAFEAGLFDGAYHLFSRSNIFFYRKQALKDEILTALPRIKTVSIKRESLLAQAVQVFVEEREASFTWCESIDVLSREESGKCYLMDKEGFIFSEARNESTEYMFKGALVSEKSPVGQTYLRGRLTAMLELLRGLEEAEFATSGAMVESEKDFRVDLKHGWYLKVSFGSDPHGVVRNLELITSSEALKGKLDDLLYVDLRFGNRVYYQLK